MGAVVLRRGRGERREVAMTCSACRGLMVRQHTFELVHRDGRACLGEWRWVWCCLGCERLVDVEPRSPSGTVAVPDIAQRSRSPFDWETRRAV